MGHSVSTRGAICGSMPGFVCIGVGCWYSGIIIHVLVYVHTQYVLLGVVAPHVCAVG